MFNNINKTRMDQNKEIRDELRTILHTYPDFPKPGRQFCDIAPIFTNPSFCTKLIDEMTENLTGIEIDAIAGIESRGYLLGMPLALKLNKPFVIVRKAGKLPGQTLQKEYELSYGSDKIEIQEGAIKEGQRVLIHDDLLATGGTADACAELVRKAGGIVTAFMFIIEVSIRKGKERLEGTYAKSKSFSLITI